MPLSTDTVSAYVHKFCKWLSFLSDDSPFAAKDALKSHYFCMLWEALSNREKEVLTRIYKSESLLPIEIYEPMGITVYNLHNTLRKLVDMGLIVKINRRYHIEEIEGEKWMDSVPQ